MTARYSEPEIEALIQEPKPLPKEWRARLRLKEKPGHRERDFDLEGSSGNEFRIILRQNRINVLDFSVILGVRVPESNQIFRLLRYNGKSHEHTNRLEGETFYDFHIHRATERYQELGPREDTYAKPTDRYGRLEEAFRCLMEDANLKAPPEPQGTLFGERLEL